MTILIMILSTIYMGINFDEWLNGKLLPKIITTEKVLTLNNTEDSFIHLEKYPLMIKLLAIL